MATGYDEVASRIKELAREHDIVQVENITLAHALANPRSGTTSETLCGYWPSFD